LARCCCGRRLRRRREGRDGYRPRQGPWPHRTTNRKRHQRGRLARRRAALSGRVAPAACGDAHPRAIARRAFGPQPLRDALLDLLGSALGEAGGAGRARPLGHREPAALDARRRLCRRPVPPAKRPRRKKHGRRQALRDQSHPHRPGARKTLASKATTQSHQAEAHPHQTSPKNRRTDRPLSRQSPRISPALTRIRSPDVEGLPDQVSLARGGRNGLRSPCRRVPCGFTISCWPPPVSRLTTLADSGQWARLPRRNRPRAMVFPKPTGQRTAGAALEAIRGVLSILASDPACQSNQNWFFISSSRAPRGSRTVQ
jgi:hypothetical protein